MSQDINFLAVEMESLFKSLSQLGMMLGMVLGMINSWHDAGHGIV